MKKTFLPLIVLLAIALSACNLTVLSGSGKIVSSNRPVSGFTRLVFDVPGDLTLTQGDKESLSIEGDDNLLEHIKSEVDGGELHIYLALEDGMIEPSKTIRYNLSVKNLEQMTVNGSGKIMAASFKSGPFAVNLNGSGEIAFGSLTATNLSLGMNGSGNVSVTNLSADDVQATVNGSGEYLLEGKATRQHINILGSGKYNAHNLQSTQADISISGSGEGQIWAVEKVNITILGSGKVGYIGKPSITQQISGSGSIYTLE